MRRWNQKDWTRGFLAALLCLCLLPSIPAVLAAEDVPESAPQEPVEWEASEPALEELASENSEPAEPAESEPAESEPAEPGPTEPEAAESEPMEPEPAEPEAPEPEPAGPALLEAVDSGTCGKDGGGNLRWTLDAAGTLTISGEGEMEDYGAAMAPWISRSEKIVRLVVEDGVTNIGRTAFFGCQSLKDAVLPESVVHIGSNAFNSCRSLESAVLPKSVSNIEAGAFRDCYALRRVELPAGFTHIREFAFAYCHNLEELSIPDSVTGIDSFAFYDCALEEVDLPEGLISIGCEAFYACSRLNDVTLPEGIRFIGEGAFDETKITRVRVPPNIAYLDDYAFPRSAVIDLEERSLTPEPALTPDRFAPAPSGNYLREMDYKGAPWDSPVRSYLMPQADDGWIRVEDAVYFEVGPGSQEPKSTLVMERYDEDGAFLQGWNIPRELPLFGGFYGGADGYYFVFGQENREEDPAAEVIRVVKYSLNLERLGSAGLFGANTYIPFDAASLRMDAEGGRLYLHTGHEMYDIGDGLHHQANMTLVLDQETLVFRQVNCDVSNLSTGYVSHSFNQFVRIDGGSLIRMDLGDSNPRAVVLTRTPVRAPMMEGSCESAELFPISGEDGVNYTGVSVGGLEVSGSGYLAVWNSIDQSSFTSGQTRNLFLAAVDRTDLSVRRVQVTDYPEGGMYSASVPALVKLGEDRFLVLWEEWLRKDSGGSYSYTYGETTGWVKFALFSGAGEQLGPVRMVPGVLSDCQPAAVDGTAVWYATGVTAWTEESLHPDNARPPRVFRLDPERDGFERYEDFLTTEDREDGTVTVTGCRADCFALRVPETLSGKQVTAVGPGAFQGQTELRRIQGTFEEIGTGAFEGCGQLESAVLLPELRRIADAAFRNCTALESVGLPAGLERIGEGAFQGCGALDHLTVPEGVTEIASAAFRDCTELRYIALPESLGALGASAFRSCTSLGSVTLPEQLEILREGTFAGCTGLYEIAFGGGLKEIGPSVFRDCTSLDDLDLPEGLERIGPSAFQNSGASQIFLPESLEEIGAHAFSGSDLITAHIPDRVASYGGPLFQDCANLFMLKLSANAAEVPAGMCAGCETLKTVTLPAGLKRVEEETFRGCSSLESLFFLNPAGDFVSGSFTAIGAQAFEGCAALKSLGFLPGGVTAAGDRAFAGCTGLTSARLPEHLTVLGEGVFEDCPALTGAALAWGMAELPARTFSGCTSLEQLEIPGSVLRIDPTALPDPAALTVYGVAGSYSESFAEWKVFLPLYLPSSGQLDASAQLRWNRRNGRISLSGPLSEEEPVLAAAYGSGGRLLSLHMLTSQEASAEIPAGAIYCTLFRVDGDWRPTCGDACIPAG